MANKILFDHDGRYLLGTKKGTHASALEPSYVTWASANIEGFREQYRILARGEALPPPRKVATPAPEGPPKRKYFLSKIRRPYIP